MISHEREKMHLQYIQLIEEDLRVATGNNLLYAFKRCHDYIHANQGGSKEQIFWEFLKLLFAKIEDETYGGRPRFAIRSPEERNDPDGKKGS